MLQRTRRVVVFLLLIVGKWTVRFGVGQRRGVSLYRIFACRTIVTNAEKITQ